MATKESPTPDSGQRWRWLRLRNDETLAWALKVADTSTSSLQDSLSAVDALVAFGMVDKADSLIRRIVRACEEQGRPIPSFITRLVALSARFRQAGIDQEVAKLGDFGRRLLSSPDEAILWEPRRSEKLLVVFTTMYDDFWASGPVLHCILRSNDTNILYLKDPQRSLYLRGLKTFGDTFEALVDGIAGMAKDLAARDIRVMGYSSGGYAGLFAAARLDATAFLGFSMRADLTPGSPLPGTRFTLGIDGRVRELLLDLKPSLRDRAAPSRAILYYGEDDPGDAAHAQHLADLPNFLVKKVPATKHGTVLALLADGEFEPTVTQFLR